MTICDVERCIIFNFHQECIIFALKIIMLETLKNIRLKNYCIGKLQVQIFRFYARDIYIYIHTQRNHIN